MDGTDAGHPDATLPAGTPRAAILSASPERPLRARAIDMAVGFEDAGPLRAFLRETDIARALVDWFGADSPVLRLPADRICALLDRDIAEIDDLLTRQVNVILHHRRFQQIESSWRGVAFLVEQADGIEDAVIRILNATWPELCRDFERAIEFDQSTLFNRVYNEEFGMPGGLPYGVLICDYAVTHRPTRERPTDDVSCLQSLSQVAAAAFAPVIIGADPALFGLETFREMGLPVDMKAAFRQDEYIRWQKLQASEDARFLGVVVPRVLMRAPYSDVPENRFGFRYREDEDGLRLEDHCWGNAVYAFGSVVLRAYGQYGWFADIRGAQRDVLGGGLVDGLPVPEFATDSSGVAIKFPGEVAISDRLEKDLDDLGFVPLNRCKDTPYLVFYGNQSVQKSAQYDSVMATANARLSSMLRYMFCIARFAHYLKVQVRDRIGSFITPEKCETDLQRWLHGFCIGNDDASIQQKARYPLREANVTVKESPGKPGTFLCIIQLRPHFQLDQVFSSFKLVTELAQTTTG